MKEALGLLVLLIAPPEEDPREGFGEGGIVLGPREGYAGGGTDRFTAVARDRSGRVVVAGWSRIGGPGPRDRALVGRFLPDGRPDPSFGRAGVVLGPLGDPARGYLDLEGTSDRFHAVAIDGEGRILAAGYAAGAGARPSSMILIARFLEDGTLDRTFGDPVAEGRAGFAVGERGRPFLAHLEPARTEDRIRSIELDADGRILAAGVATAFRPTWFNQSWLCEEHLYERAFCWARLHLTLVLRFTPEGELDPRFGGKGRVLGDAEGGNWWTGPHDEFLAVLAARDGGALAAGWVSGPTYDEERTLLARYGTDGQLFAPWLGGGSMLGPARSYAGGAKEVFHALVRHPSGGYVAGGFSFDDRRHIQALLVRLSEDGAIDERFGDRGTVLEPARSLADSDIEYFLSAAVDREGRVVVSGYTDDRWAYGDEVDRGILVRYTKDGRRDVSFNPTARPAPGVITTWTDGRSEIAGGVDDAFLGVIADERARIFVAGTSGGRALLLRLDEEGCLDAPGPCRN